MKKFLLSILILFLSGCHKSSENSADKPNSDFNRKRFYGEWHMIPSENNIRRISFDPDGRILLNQNGKIHQLYGKIDSVGLRILKNQQAKTPTGYFLFKEFKEKKWPGLWQDESVQLVRISPVSESTLK